MERRLPPIPRPARREDNLCPMAPTTHSPHSPCPHEDTAFARAARDLRPAAIFQDLDDATLARVAVLARPRAYKGHTLLAEPPGLGGAIHVVTCGRVRLARQSARGREVTLDLVRAGDAFKFLAYDASGTPRSSAEALGTPTIVYQFPAAPLLTALASCPQALLHLVALLEGKLADAYARLEEAVLCDTKTRLAGLLVRRAWANERRHVGETHQELAWWIGARREEVTRALQVFEAHGLVAPSPHGRGLVVLNVDGLLAR